MELIDKAAVVAEIERRIKGVNRLINIGCSNKEEFLLESRLIEEIHTYEDILDYINTLEVKEVNIAEMADDYYDALMQEADWMDEGTIGHCRLAYYNGCKDVLNKIRKGE